MVATLNKHRRQLLQNALPPGATVMLKDMLRSNKFEPKYVGPYTVMRRTRAGTYVVRDATGDMLDRHVPADQLILVSRKPRASDLANNTYEVEAVLSHRGQPGNYEYEVKWTGYPKPTWEPATSFLDNAVITAYWRAAQGESGVVPGAGRGAGRSSRRSAGRGTGATGVRGAGGIGASNHQ